MNLSNSIRNIWTPGCIKNHIRKTRVHELINHTRCTPSPGTIREGAQQCWDVAGTLTCHLVTCHKPCSGKLPHWRTSDLSPGLSLNAIYSADGIQLTSNWHLKSSATQTHSSQLFTPNSLVPMASYLVPYRDFSLCLY
jgi:hypothetical protein